MKYYLYNPLANNGIRPSIADEHELTSVIGLNYQEFFDNLNSEDEVVIIGGDGTLNHLVCYLDCENLKNKIYYYAGGTGNDFLNDINGKMGEEIYLNDYLKALPTVEVNGLKRKFINGIGYGIDGYCCEEADNIKEVKPNAKINYTKIALKGLFGKFSPRHCTLVVDGVKQEFDHTWIACSMKGRFYGGGMMIAPIQDRKNKTVTVCIVHCKRRMKILASFPKIFKGTHVNLNKIINFYTGHTIEVSFDSPCALQIDGDTVRNVTTYKVHI